MPFNIPNVSPLSTSQALTVLLSQTSNPEFVCLCRGFHRPGPDFFFCSHFPDVVSLLHSLLAFLVSSLLYMDLFCWIWVVFVCTWWLGVSADGMGRKVLSDMHGASSVLFETGFWDFIIYIWAIWAIIPILAISIA